MVTIQDFVRETLREIVEGDREAQKLVEVGGQIAPQSIGGMKFPPESGIYYEARMLATAVKFDIAVTVESRKEGETGGVWKWKPGLPASTTPFTTLKRLLSGPHIPHDRERRSK